MQPNSSLPFIALSASTFSWYLQLPHKCLSPLSEPATQLGRLFQSRMGFISLAISIVSLLGRRGVLSTAYCFVKDRVEIGFHII